MNEIKMRSLMKLTFNEGGSVLVTNSEKKKKVPNL